MTGPRAILIGIVALCCAGALPVEAQGLDEMFTVVNEGAFDRIENYIKEAGGQRSELEAEFMSVAGAAGRIDMLEKLLGTGIPIDASPKATLAAGGTAFGQAAVKDHPETVRWLLAHGANPNVTGYCAEVKRPACRTLCEGHAPLAWAVQAKSAEIVRLLLDAGADPAVLDHLATEKASTWNLVEIYELLVARGGRIRPEHPFARKYPDLVAKAKVDDEARNVFGLPAVAELLPTPPLPPRRKTRERCRLALIADEGNRALADLLTVRLSSEKGLELVERQDLERVLAEQSLSRALAVEAATAARLGGLLQADALLLLRNRQLGSAAAVEARFVRVNPGIVLESVCRPAPIEQPAAFAAVLAPRVLTLASQALRPDATAVSLLRVRSTVSSGGGAVLERMLSALLTQRLAANPQFVLLERTAMERLAAESSDPFWTGKYVVTAAIMPALDASGLFDFELSFEPPNGGAAMTGRASGKRQAPGPAVDEALAAVAGKLGRIAGAAIPADEARRFAAEARAALLLGLYRTSREAADCAWALGERTPEVGKHRILAGLRLLSSVKKQFEARLPSGASGELASDLFRHPLRGPECPTAEEWLWQTETCLFLWRDGLPQATAESPETLRDWLQLYLEVHAGANAAFWIIDTAREKVNQRERLAALRSTWQLAFAEARAAAARLPDAASEMEIAAAAVCHAETLEPIKTIDLVRECLALHFRTDDAYGRARVRQSLYANATVFRDTELRVKIALELTASARPEDRLTGCYLLHSPVVPPADKGPLEHTAMEAFEAMIDDFTADVRVLDIYIQQLQLMDEVKKQMDPRRPLVKRKTQDLPQRFEYSAEYRALCRRVMLALFQRGTELGRSAFWLSNGLFEGDEQALLPAAREWLARTTAAGARLPWSPWMAFAGASNAPASAAGPAPPEALRFERLWDVRDLLPKPETPGLSQAIVFAEGCLWMHGMAGGGLFSGEPKVTHYIFRIQLPSLTTEVLAVPPQENNAAPDEGSRLGSSLFLHQGRIYLLARNHFLGIYDRATKHWEIVHSIRPEGRAVVVGEAAFMLLADGRARALARYDLRTGKTELLASPRREPPQTPLDGPHLEINFLSRGAADEIIVDARTKTTANEKVEYRSYSYLPATAEWRPTPTYAQRAAASADSLKRVGELVYGRVLARGPASDLESVLRLRWISSTPLDQELPLAFVIDQSHPKSESPLSDEWRLKPKHGDIIGCAAGIIFPGGIVFNNGFWFLPRSAYDEFAHAHGYPLLPVEQTP
ncbi:MAG: hypothetical protein QOE70_251 [Chthoniobacter sp.]|nr:hypothetical protein [Chthoniobacter sp.]